MAKGVEFGGLHAADDLAQRQHCRLAPYSEAACHQECAEQVHSICCQGEHRFLPNSCGFPLTTRLEATCASRMPRYHRSYIVVRRKSLGPAHKFAGKRKFLRGGHSEAEQLAATFRLCLE